MADTAHIGATGNSASGPPSGLIEARNLCKGFNNSGQRIEILKNLDLLLNRGDSIAVVGASGIGKSTLLYLLGALDRPEKGTVWYQGENIFLFDHARLAKFRNQSIGFVFQFHHLLPEFSAIENVMIPALIQRIEKTAARQAAEDILVKVGLKDRLQFKIGKLSGGEQQRVALARALVLKPGILLADEPTGNLDKRNSEQVHGLLQELNRELKMAMVVVTHNMELAAYMSRTLSIVDGKLMEMS